MPVTNYHTVNGRLIGETTAGVRTDYLTDALGSITATVNESAQIINTYRYKPFGERLAKTGSGADPRFQFTGETGSVTTARRYAENYNRRRSLDVKNGRWGSVDPLWPRQPAYAFVAANPSTFTDPQGLEVKGIGCEEGDIPRMKAACKTLRDCLQNKPSGCLVKLLKCIGPISPPGWLEGFLNRLVDTCLAPTPDICIVCGEDKLPRGCRDICRGAIGVTIKPLNQGQLGLELHYSNGLVVEEIPYEPVLGVALPRCGVKDQYRPCYFAIASEMPSLSGCGCISVLCKGKGRSSLTFLHELSHCAGLDHINGAGKRDLVDRIEECIKTGVGIK